LALAADQTVLLPMLFVAVTARRMYRFRSLETTLYPSEVPLRAVQPLGSELVLAPAEVQRYQR
jgi:hypothetical protein